MSEWVMKSLVAFFAFSPIFIATPILQKNLGVRPEALLVWWFSGTVVGVCLWFGAKGQTNIFAPSVPLIIVGFIGITIGTMGNVSFFQAIAKAPNPGLAIAIVNSNFVVIFFASVFLACALPRLVVGTQLTWQHLTGLLLVMAGIFLIAVKR